MTLRGFRDMLLTLGMPVYHYVADKQPDKYIAWHEYNTDGYHSDNVRGPRVRSIQVDLFTREEFDPLADRVEALLDACGVAYDGPQTDYEEDTKYIHFWWDCEVVDG